METCESCNGSGIMEVEEDCAVCHGTGTESTDCSRCDGSGEVEDGDSIVECPVCFGSGNQERECAECLGDGCSFYEDACSDCNGAGEVEEEHNEN